jgi:hypothetical protein
MTWFLAIAQPAMLFALQDTGEKSDALSAGSAG